MFKDRVTEDIAIVANLFVKETEVHVRERYLIGYRGREKGANIVDRMLNVLFEQVSH
jgi:hypothetical protein